MCQESGIGWKLRTLPRMHNRRQVGPVDDINISRLLQKISGATLENIKKDVSAHGLIALILGIISIILSVLAVGLPLIQAN